LLKSPLLASELVIEPVALAQPVAGKRQQAKGKRQKAKLNINTNQSVKTTKIQQTTTNTNSKQHTKTTGKRQTGKR
jgi:hypothetical protein